MLVKKVGQIKGGTHTKGQDNSTERQVYRVKDMSMRKANQIILFSRNFILAYPF